MKIDALKKVLGQITLALFLISFALLTSSKSVRAAEMLCCPEGYSDSWFICPFGTDRNMQCCKWLGPFNYDIVDKIACTEQPTPSPSISPEVSIPQVNQSTLNALNPLQASTKAQQLSTPGGIISEFLKYAFPIAGFILFLMLIFGGFRMLTGATNSKSVEEGKGMITSAIFGFLLLFAAYWIVQLIELIFGINILF